MLRAQMVALPLVAVGLLGGKAAGNGQEARVLRAAAAPLRDVLAHRPAAVCADVVPEVAATLVAGATPGTSCEAGLREAFASTAANEEPPNAGLWAEAVKISLTLTGTHAVAKLRIKYTESTHESNGVRLSRSGETSELRLELEEEDGRWLMSSRVKLTVNPGCHLVSPRRCGSGAKVLSLSMGTLAGPRVYPAPPTPAVHGAGRGLTARGL